MVLHPRDPNVAYVAAVGNLWRGNPERGVYKTTDAGKTWAKVLYVDTLTGAVKVAMGEGLPGMFSNSDALAADLLKAGKERGDNSWRLPLDPGQKSKLKSDVADMVNSAGGFGGAVTAALFLEAFVAGVPWAHFDIYAWTSNTGVFNEKGGNGQMVQCLSQFCEGLK